MKLFRGLIETQSLACKEERKKAQALCMENVGLILPAFDRTCSTFCNFLGFCLGFMNVQTVDVKRKTENESSWYLKSLRPASDLAPNSCGKT